MFHTLMHANFLEPALIGSNQLSFCVGKNKPVHLNRIFHFWLNYPFKFALKKKQKHLLCPNLHTTHSKIVFKIRIVPPKS